LRLFIDVDLDPAGSACLAVADLVDDRQLL
jgi:hypothetical protein